MLLKYLLILLPTFIFINSTSLPTKCESCAIIAREFKNELLKIKSLPEKINRVKGEELFLELSDLVCNNMLKYRLDPSNGEGLDRFVKGTPEALKQLKKMANNGVKVTMDVPKELWDKPGVESSILKQHCETILEEYEDIIIDSIRNKASFEIFVCTIEMKCQRFYNKDTKKEL
uniref:DUF3456 domain-containing protein n=1 Tax=Parastrongyloides trichosuri TaxID=131310 RepID=A0A0N4Z471_PARTI